MMPAGDSIEGWATVLKKFRAWVPAHSLGDSDEGRKRREELPELEDIAWYAHAEEAEKASFWRMARRLPKLVQQAVSTAWAVSPALTVAAMVLNVLAGVATTTALLAVTDVTTELFATGPSWDRVLAATPSLVLLAAATAGQVALGIGAGWVQQRLEPLIANQVEFEFYKSTTEVPRAAYDDDDFADLLHAARDRGIKAVTDLVTNTIDLVTAVVTVIAVAMALIVIHAALLPLLFAAALPTGWAAVKSARLMYQSNRSRVSRRRRLWMIEMLLADRYGADDLRLHEAGRWLRGQHQAMVDAETKADFDIIDRQTFTRAIGQSASGLATVAVYGVLLWMLATGAVPLAVATAAVLAMQRGSGATANLLVAVNEIYDSGLYASDYEEFRSRAAAKIAAQPHLAVSAPESADREILPVPEVVTVEGVSFRYPGKDTDTLTDVSLTIRRGETIALVGENGSGKTIIYGFVGASYV
jgi:ATP-binding cassette, subfamily B, bacterial